MEKEVAFQILNMEKSRDEEAIQASYRALLRVTNPEDDPEGFKRLRLALETALEYARENNTDKDMEGPKSDVDLWLDRVEQFYDKLPTRYQKSGWQELLDDPVCEALDTSLEARERMLIFLMEHIHLPHEIWKMIDQVFEYMDDMEMLKQQFPENFLHYMKYYVENDTFFSYDQFEYRNQDEEDINGDSYIEGLMMVKRKLDAGETDGCMQELDDLRAYGVYHPYEDVERLRLYIQAKDTAECSRIVGVLLDKIPEDLYCQVYVGEAYWEMGQKESAHEIWTDVLEKRPDYYQAKYDMVRYLMDQGEWYEARELMHELLDKDGNDERVQKLLTQANDKLIPEYRGKLERGEEDEHFPGGELVLELGWCLFQNDIIEDAITLLENFSPPEEQKYGYCNLFGRILYQSKQYERALPYLEDWKRILWEMKEDGTEETKKRISRRNMAASILAACYFEVGERKKSIQCVKDAIDMAADRGEQLGSMQQLAGLFLECKEYERAVDVCDSLIREDDGYYPAYLIRQEACFELQKYQEVVDDYHLAINIFPGYYKPYLFAAEAFFFYGQYEDGRDVLKLAQENGVSLTSRMKLCKAKILRNLAKNKEDRRAVLLLLDEVEDAKGDEDFDIEDDSEIVFERALLCWDAEELNGAAVYIRQAIQENPSRLQYHLVCGNIYIDSGKYKQALAEYQQAEPDYFDNPGLHYGRGLCYERMGFEVLAIENYQKALECKKVYADACEKVSDYYNRQYHKFHSREYFDKALKYATQQIEEREDCYCLIHRGLIYMDALELKPAIADFEKALTYQEDDWAAWNNLGCCYKYMGQFERAITCFEKAVEYMGDKRDILPYSNMADCYEALGQYQKAIECYRRNLEIMPGDIEFWMEIGDMYYYMNQLDKALEAYENTRTRSECHREYYSKVGNVWIKRGDRKKGISYYKRGIRTAVGSDKARYLYQLGQLYTDELLDFKKGIYYLKHAAQLSENSLERFDCERYLAKSYYRLGDKRNAKKHAQKALQHFDDSKQGTPEEYIAFRPYAPIHLEHFGWLYLCLGDVKRAEEYFKRMEKVNRCKTCRYKECYESQLYMGDLFFTQGNTELAEAAYRETLKRNPHCNEASAALHFIKKEEK